MLKKILVATVIPISVIVIIFSAYGLSSQELNDVSPKENNPLTIEIENKINQIEQENKLNYYNYTDYDPTREREWLTSGPFQIDRSVYYLGEKIFTNINDLKINESGIIQFVKPINSTHYKIFQQIPFDGSKKNVFNYYYEPKLSGVLKICSVNEIIGDWQVIFVNTNYNPLYFKIINQTIPGDEEKFNPVC